ncbi:mobile element transfer protein [Streptomyces sp. NPDC057521]
MERATVRTTWTTKHAAVCTADRCGWSSDYCSQSAAQLAARTHRCRVR